MRYKYLCVVVLLAMSWSPPAFAHESEAELAAIKAEAEQQQRDYAHTAHLKDVADRHGADREYMDWVNGWQVRLLVMPVQADSGESVMQVFVSDQDNQLPALEQVALIVMGNVRKVVMQREGDHFTAAVRLPAYQETMLMVKLKDENLKNYFVKFQH